MNRREIAKEYERINRKYEVKYFPKVKKSLDKKLSSLITVIENRGLDAGRSYLSQDLVNIPLRLVVQDLYKDVGMRHARRTEVRLRKEEGRKSLRIKAFSNAETWLKFITEYLSKFLLEKITFKVNETLRDHLLRVINEGINKGLGVNEIVNNLKDTEFTRYQAARIVRTETNRAANVGVKAQGETYGYEQTKEWISVKDARTRGANPEDHADHFRMDGQVVDFTAKFRDPKNGHLLEFPGDPNAAAGDVIQCRCQMATRAKRDASGRLIPKRNITVIRPGQFVRPTRTVTI